MSHTEFEGNQYEFAYPDGIDKNFWNSARNKIILNYINKIPKGKVLDVGCGRGIVTDFLFRNGIDVTGVELGITKPINDSPVSIKYNTDVFSLDDAFSKQVSVITLFDVIEHLEDPVDFIKRLKAHFINCQYFMFTIPARKELWSNYDEFYGHIKRYDMQILIQEMNEAGLNIYKSRYFFHSLYYTMVLSNFIRKKRTIQFIPPKGGVSLAINKFIGTAFYMEYLIAQHFIPGSSIICIAKVNS